MDDLVQDICFRTEPEFHAAKSNGYNQRLIQKIKNNGIRVYIECGFAKIFNLRCYITVLQNQAVCGIQEYSGNFNAICIFLMFFCSVFTQISVQCSYPLTLPCDYQVPMTQSCVTRIIMLLVSWESGKYNNQYNFQAKIVFR